MTFQFLKLCMIDKARKNNGFIDQTEFKTASKYAFDTLIITQEVFTVLDLYIDYIRPLLIPKCEYLLISNNGNQYTSLTSAMTLLVHQAIGKYIHPTRYRQIVETASAERLSRQEQDSISEDQKHSSTVAKVFYKKKQSRNVALEGKRCMEKMLGDTRLNENNRMSSVLSELNHLNKKLVNRDNSVNYKLPHVSTNFSPFIKRNEYCTNTKPPVTNEDTIKQTPCLQTNHQNMDFAIQTERKSSSQMLTDSSCYSSYESCSVSQMESILQETEKLLGKPIPTKAKNRQEEDFQVQITGSISGDDIMDETVRYDPRCISNVEIKREVVSKETAKAIQNIAFTKEEDKDLRRGIQKYGVKSWAAILKDKELKFHRSRTRDSLRMRANSATFKKIIFKQSETADSIRVLTL